MGPALLGRTTFAMVSECSAGEIAYQAFVTRVPVKPKPSAYLEMKMARASSNTSQIVRLPSSGCRCALAQAAHLSANPPLISSSGLEAQHRRGEPLPQQADLILDLIHSPARCQRVSNMLVWPVD